MRIFRLNSIKLIGVIKTVYAAVEKKRQHGERARKTDAGNNIISVDLINFGAKNKLLIKKKPKSRIRDHNISNIEMRAWQTAWHGVSAVFLITKRYGREPRPEMNIKQVKFFSFLFNLCT